MISQEKANDLIAECPCNWKKAQLWSCGMKTEAFMVECSVGQCHRQGPKIPVTPDMTEEQRDEAAKKAIEGWNALFAKPMPESVRILLETIPGDCPENVKKAVCDVLTYYKGQ